MSPEEVSKGDSKLSGWFCQMQILLIFPYLLHHVVVRLRCEPRGKSILRDWKGGMRMERVVGTLLRGGGDLGSVLRRFVVISEDQSFESPWCYDEPQIL